MCRREVYEDVMRFSIVIPVYNADRYLVSCLDSIRKQSFCDWECVCINDGSSDTSGSILDHYALMDVRFKVVHQSNEGGSSARNVGLKIASGEILTWVDADDILVANTLKKVDLLFQKYKPDLVRLSHRQFIEDDEVQLSDFPESSFPEEIIEGNVSVRNWAISVLTGEGYCWGTFCNRKLISADFPVGVQYAEDSLYMLENACGLRKVIQSNFIGYFYRNTPGSVMKRSFPSAERLLFFVNFQRIQSLYGDPHPRFSWMGWFHLVNFAIRPRDVLARIEIHDVFCNLVGNGVIQQKDLPAYARPSFMIYKWLGWLWPIVLTYRILAFGIWIRDFVCLHQRRCLW